MFSKVLALFALFAVALAAPKPAPAPQYLAYTPSLDYGAYAAPAVVSPYAAPYSAQVPLTYSALPASTYYVR